uniref:Uncharacterized protein n=1 Tax=Globisporangium ultimum (strain ATCC 200006 / CBS 805.95 / DAOM BR144) TaxID=431595 RepID=K3WYA3_GLOUD
MELQCLSELEQSIENSHVPSLLHMFAYERAATTNQTSSSRSEEDASKEASSTFSLTDLKEQTSSYPNRCSKDGEQTTQESEGMHIFAGDDQGFVSVWFVPHHHVNDAKSTTSVHLLASNDATSETATSATNSSATVMFQHEEMVLGYDAIAGLYMRALEKNHAEAMPQSNPTGRYPSLTRREKKASSQRILAPRLRWRAHSGPILCLNFAIDPLVALTSSTRGRIKVWSFDGELLGILDDFASRRKPVTQPWCFPVDMTERRRRKEHAAQQFLEKSKGLFRRNKQARMSIMQERLSLSHEELTFNYTAEKKTIQSRRHSRWSNIQVRGSDVTRAIRKFILKQAALAQGSPTPSALRRNGTNHEPSLQVVLKEIDQLQLQTSARGAAGENNPSLIRKKYP